MKNFLRHDQTVIAFTSDTLSQLHTNKIAIINLATYSHMTIQQFLWKQLSRGIVDKRMTLKQRSEVTMLLSQKQLPNILDEVQEKFGRILGQSWSVVAPKVASLPDGSAAVSDKLTIWNGKDTFVLDCNDKTCQLSRIVFETKEGWGIPLIAGCAQQVPDASRFATTYMGDVGAGAIQELPTAQDNEGSDATGSTDGCSVSNKVCTADTETQPQDTIEANNDADGATLVDGDGQNGSTADAIALDGLCCIDTLAQELPPKDIISQPDEVEPNDAQDAYSEKDQTSVPDQTSLSETTDTTQIQDIQAVLDVVQPDDAIDVLMGSDPISKTDATDALAPLDVQETVETSDIKSQDAIDQNDLVPLDSGGQIKEIPVKIAISDWVKCFVTNKQNLYCWGRNSFGQAGIGIFNDPIVTPTKVPLAGVTDVSAGNSAACAVVAGGNLYCWGDNSQGDVGISASTNKISAPVKVPFLDKSGNPLNYAIKSVAVTSHACAADETGALYCWGYNLDNSPNLTLTFTPTLNSKINDVAVVAAHYETTCVLTKTSKEVYCWGSGPFGTTPADPMNPNYPTPVKIPLSNGADALAVSNIGCFRKSGELYCWNKDVAKVPTLTQVNQFAVGSGNYFAINGPNNNFYVWGNNLDYKLGDSTTNSKPTPTPNLYLKNALAVAASDLGGCAIGTDNKVYCWGWDSFFNTVTTTPTEVPLPAELQ